MSIKDHIAQNPYTQLHGLAKAIEYVMGIGVENIRDHVMNVTQRLMEELSGMGAQLLTPFSREQRAGIVTARFDAWTTTGL